MNDTKRILLWATLVLIIVLTGLSVYGAFLGAERAKVFFNSAPLALYWIVFLVTLIAGGVMFKRLIRAPGLLLIHAGCIAILLGGMLGSGAGYHIRETWFGQKLIPEGMLAVANGQSNNKVYLGKDGYVVINGQPHLFDYNAQQPRPVTGDKDVMELPFDVHVDEYRIEHYPGSLYVLSSRDQQQWTLVAEPNSTYDLGGAYGTVRIAKAFKNFKLMIQDGNSVPYDAPGRDPNPALEVYVTPPGGTPIRRFVFRQGGHGDPSSPLQMNYSGGAMVKDYISDLRVMKDGQCVAEKSIEVNHPLYYGGYHFYQSSYGYDLQTGQAHTVLSVVCNAGLYWIYAGYIALCLGIIWQLWFKRLRTPRTREAS
jgi:hypothetical protein